MSDRPSTAARSERELAAEWRSLIALGRGLTHDLRSPINGMVLQIELFDADLAKGGDLDRATTKRRVESIKRELGRLRASLDRLLAFLVPESANERCDLAELLPALVATIGPAARERSIEVELGEITGPLPVEGEHTRLRGALLAILVSALEEHDGAEPLRVDVATDGGDGVIVSLAAGSKLDPDAERTRRERLRAAAEACELAGARSSRLDVTPDGRARVLVTLPRRRHIASR